MQLYWRRFLVKCHFGMLRVKCHMWDKQSGFFAILGEVYMYMQLYKYLLVNSEDFILKCFFKK